MKISAILAAKRAKNPREPIFSFEFFPPKTPKGEESLFQTVKDLRSLHPDFISVTYGAGGSTRSKTLEWVETIKRDHGIETMAHLTCVGASRYEIAGVLDELVETGIENVLALRGDPPRGSTSFVKPADGFGHAGELVEFIRRRQDPVSIGVAGYPEKHPEAPDLETDMARLREKAEKGADFVITQLFFENASYFDFVRRLKAHPDWNCDVIPGIMPITSKEQIGKFILMCGAKIPDALRTAVETASSDEEVVEIGIAWAIRQVKELLVGGAPGIHFYTLNKSPATRRILEGVTPLPHRPHANP
ncbi:MAG: methylenetetrahydrofolate reductase [NAD(P)H] [Candidatus Hydrogenedentota bacterium]